MGIYEVTPDIAEMLRPRIGRRSAGTSIVCLPGAKGGIKS
jgi:hypothetical protein